jgi:hypothetical protein
MSEEITRRGSVLFPHFFLVCHTAVDLGYTRTIIKHLHLYLRDPVLHLFWDVSKHSKLGEQSDSE